MIGTDVVTAESAPHRGQVQSSEPLELILKKAKNSTYAPSVAFKRAGRCTLIVPSRSTWQGRGREILKPEDRARGAIDLAERRRARVAVRELEQARRAKAEKVMA